MTDGGGAAGVIMAESTLDKIGTTQVRPRNLLYYNSTSYVVDGYTQVHAKPLSRHLHLLRLIPMNSLLTKGLNLHAMKFEGAQIWVSAHGVRPR